MNNYTKSEKTAVVFAVEVIFRIRDSSVNINMNLTKNGSLRNLN